MKKVLVIGGIVVAVVGLGVSLLATHPEWLSGPPVRYRGENLYVFTGDLAGIDAEAAPPLAVAEASGPWMRRFRDEVLVFGREARAEVTIRYPDLKGKITSRLDANGVLRVRVPEAAIPNDAVDIYADREQVRPGDLLELCLRVTDEDAARKPIAMLEFDPAEPAVPPVPLFRRSAPTATGADVEPSKSPRWERFFAHVPEDVRPGKAVVVCGSRRLALPLVPRFGPSRGEVDGPPGGTPDTPPPSSVLALSFRDGQWHARGPEGTTAILFFAEAGGRLVVHEGVLALDDGASATLPLGERPPAGARVIAVAATPKGFVEASLAVPGAAAAPGLPPEVASFLSSRPRAEGPDESIPIREGDALANSSSGTLEDDLSHVFESIDVPVGRACALFADGRAAAPGSKIRWRVVPASAKGSLRVRAADSILLETRIGQDLHEGTLPAADVGDRALLVESDAPGLKHVEFMWKPAPRGHRREEEPARPGQVLSVERRLPEKGRVGDEVEYHIAIHSRAGGRLFVECPIPAGALPAEEGWQIRERSPAGTRVHLDSSRAAFEVPTARAGETALSFRVRFRLAGRFTVPPVKVRAQDLPEGGPLQDSANTASGRLVVE